MNLQQQKVTGAQPVGGDAGDTESISITAVP